MAGAGAPAASAVACPAPTVTVHTAAELTAALAAAKPGASIWLSPGVYTGNFVATVSGTASQPIYLCGTREAILDGGNTSAGYALHLNPASYWRVVGFTLRNAQKGVVTDATAHSEIQQLDVYDIGDEGIHLRSASTYNIVLNNIVTQTGLHEAKFGEGIYVGSARKNWGLYGAGGPDRSDHNVIQGNTISATGAESIDIKEGTTGGAILYNSFDGTGMKGADSWVDVKGNDWLIEGNIGRNAPTDGFQTHQIVSGWGTGNVFINNTADVNASGYAFHLTPINQNIVSCANTFSGAEHGLTNTTCTD
jgi:Right handed beta helix region